MADDPKTPNGEAQETAPIPRTGEDDRRDTALEPAVDFDDDHLPRDTAPLERADLDAIRALAEAEAEAALGGPTDEIEVDPDALADDDDEPSDDTLNDTVASEAVDDDDD